MSSMSLIPVTLCGGSGSRLWPLSRKSYPKQFLNLDSNSDKSLLQITQKRLLSLKNILSPILICNEEHRFIVAEQMRSIGVKPSSIILESEGKNTAAAITVASIKCLEIKEDPILIILASDHLIEHNDKFIKSLESAIDLALEDKIVTFGILPKSAETGYGYIESKNSLNVSNFKGSEIIRFFEKPSKKLAQEFIKDKRFSWNSGMFIFKASVILEEIKKFSPDIYKSCKKSIDKSKKDLDFLRLDQKAFSKCPSLSIDIAVMEKTKIGAVVPLDANWNDIGSWQSLWEYEKKDDLGNFSQGKIILKDVKNSFFRSEGRLIVGIGVSDLIAIETHDAILILNKDKSQEIKNIVEEMKSSGMKEASEHSRGYRPWGKYLSIAQGKNWLLKLIEVNPGAKLSLQRHKFRAEHWIIVRGSALVTIENEKKILNENQSTFIPQGAKHQLTNNSNSPLNVIEVQSGSYLEEDDIERFEDIYGRV